MPLAPHCTAGFLGSSASLHVAAAIPLFLTHEFYPNIGQFQGIARMERRLAFLKGHVEAFLANAR